MLTCPVCRSRAIRRSARRTILERLRSLGGQYPYRCRDCQTRFFAYRVPHEARDEEDAPSAGEVRETPDPREDEEAD